MLNELCRKVDNRSCDVGFHTKKLFNLKNIKSALGLIKFFVSD